MGWIQNRQPNLDPYLKANGAILTNWLGWCLLYVQTAFAAGWAGACANDGWNAHTVNKHADANFPVGVYFCVWFDWFGTIDGVYRNWGHVAIAFINANGQMNIWSAPISRKPYADTWSSIAQVEQNYRAKFVGWSEGLGGTQVITWQPDAPAPAPTNTQGANEMIANEAQAHQAYQLLRPNADGTPDEIAATAGKRSWAAFASDARGEIAARNQSWTNMQNQVAALTAQAAELNVRPTKENFDALKTQLDTMTAQFQADEAKLAEYQNRPAPTKPVVVATQESSIKVLVQKLAAALAKIWNAK